MTQYLVTVKKGTDIDAFYNDMETSGGSSTIPDREVTCYKRKPISRTTGYDLEDSEVESLLNDDRVIGIDSQELLDSVVTRPLWEQTSSDWYKGSTISNTMKNWGLYRCVLGSQVTNWGDDGTNNASDTIRTTSSGKNVDVVIVDGQFDPNHPEFAVNPDGTGGTRVQQFNWLSLTSQVTGGSNGTYTYRSGTNLNNEDDNHGAHVAGTVAGNTQGWARDANIYYIDPFSGPTAGDVAYDYVRAWHNQKSVNPETGRRNPTIVNSSIGSYIYKTRSAVTGVVYRGTTYNAPESGFTDAQLDSYGIRHYGLHPSGSGVEVLFIPISTSQFTQYLPTIEDLVDDGIILVGAAGNGSLKIDVEDGTDWDNRTQGGSALYYNRGHWQSSTSKTGVPPVGGQRLVVCVGAVSDLVNESKATYSNCGPRVDIFAPGVWIISAVHDDTGGGPVKPDLRNT